MALDGFDFPKLRALSLSEFTLLPSLDLNTLKTEHNNKLEVQIRNAHLEFFFLLPCVFVCVISA